MKTFSYVEFSSRIDEILCESFKFLISDVIIIRLNFKRIF